MDSTSIITQVNREEEQLTNFPPDRVPPSSRKPRQRGFLNTLLCCFGSNNQGASNPVIAEENGQYSPKPKEWHISGEHPLRVDHPALAPVPPVFRFESFAQLCTSGKTS
ncbi:hypothetical protein HPB49_026386 [Dermacentor silvarum]|nr:hypothetical protein HPB49_026386 [Dermacentor silvarum]